MTIENTKQTIAPNREQKKKEVYTITDEIARGGEGIIWKVKKHPEFVAKQFHKPDVEKTKKIKAMLANQPVDPTRKIGHISIAWPISPLANLSKGKSSNDSVYDGYIMPHIDVDETFTLFILYNPQDRRETRLTFTWEYLLRIALNLASIVTELHRKGYVIGDLNESNFIAKKNALVTLVDCDSIQVPKHNIGWWHQVLFGTDQEYFLCTVGKPEYTPPELQDRDFSKVVRTPNHDNFGLAVLIFLTLMEGWHPFAAVWKGQGMAPSLEENIQRGNFPYVGNRMLFHPKYAPLLEILPPRIQHLMKRCFVDRHKPLFPWLKRPSARQWREALLDASHNLMHCQVNNSHVYSNHLSYCPWCERMKLGIPDPFPKALGSKHATSDQSKQHISGTLPTDTNRQPAPNMQERLGRSILQNKLRPNYYKQHPIIRFILVLLVLALIFGTVFTILQPGFWNKLTSNANHWLSQQLSNFGNWLIHIPSNAVSWFLHLPNHQQAIGVYLFLGIVVVAIAITLWKYLKS